MQRRRFRARFEADAWYKSCVSVNKFIYCSRDGICVEIFFFLIFFLLQDIICNQFYKKPICRMDDVLETGV